MAYASAKFAIALCDRCGFRYKLLELRKEWNGLKTWNVLEGHDALDIAIFVNDQRQPLASFLELQ